MKSLKESLINESDLQQKYKRYNKIFNIEPNKKVKFRGDDPGIEMQMAYALANFLGEDLKNMKVTLDGNFGDGTVTLDVNSVSKGEVTISVEGDSEECYIYVNYNGNEIEIDDEEVGKLQYPLGYDFELEGCSYGIFVKVWKKYVK